MPALGADMDAGTVVAWLVSPGDHVSRGDVVAEVDTEKSVIDVEVFATGTIEEILVPVGERVPVGTALARIREDEPAGAPEPTTPEPTTPEPLPLEPTPTPAAPARERVATSPRARRRAAELGVDLGAVSGTGPGGAVTTEDVEAAARVAPAPAALPEPAREPPAEPAPQPRAAALAGEERRAALRRAVAEAMTRSKREVPHYYLTADVEMSAALTLLEARNARAPVAERILPVAVLVRATALALAATPALNGHWVEGAFRPGDGVHVGVAIAMKGGGLVAPAVADADALPLAELMARLHDLVRRARTGGLRAAEMSAPTATVTSLGDQAVDAVLPVVYPPQVAIVGFGRIRVRPWVHDGTLVAAPVLTATLAADHRASDGHVGATFLGALERLLQRPEDL